MSRRTVLTLLAVLAVGGGATSALAATAGAAATPAALPAVGGTTLLAGSTPATTPFPSDAFTVADATQLSGRRIALPTAGCGSAGRSLCDDLALVNQLDGFDLQPRVTLPFSGPVNLLSVTPADVHIDDPSGKTVGGLVKLVFDPATNTVAGESDAFLAPDTTYSLVVAPGITALDGTLVADASRTVPFTTLSSTSVLDSVTKALDNGSAYTAAGIDSGQQVDTHIATGGGLSVFTGVPAGDSAITRNDQTSADTSQPLVSSAVLDSSAAVYKGFGSIQSPQYADSNAVIANVGTASTPQPLGRATIGVAVMAAAKPATGCLRPVIFGPGFTRSKYDVFLSSDMLATTGGSAVFATDPVGHSFGPTSSWTVMHGASTTSGSAFGRGHDLDGDGMISDSEGSQPSFTVDAKGVPTTPSPDALVGLRDALIQTVIDNETLVRALEKGVDLDGDGTVDTCVKSASDPHPVTYYGQSFGGIYGTMLLGTDPEVVTGVPNVPGGPVTDIARLSSFRGNIAGQLQANKPSLLNGGAGNNGFTESIPLRLDPRVTNPVPGAIAIQEYFARGAWVERAGSPETYAPALSTTGRFATKKVIFQTEYTDGTVPNPTANDIYRALGDYSRVWIFRNDRTATYTSDPHGSLLDPRLDTRNLAQEQINDFVTSDGATVTDPDAAGDVVEQGTATGTDYPVQLNCLHFPDPQTGMDQTRTMGSPDCTDLSGTVTKAQVMTAPVTTGPTAPPATVSPSATVAPSASASPSVSPSVSASPSVSPSTSPATPARTLTLSVDRTFVPYGAPQVYRGTLRTIGGGAVPGIMVSVTEQFIDGPVVPLGQATTAADGSWSMTVHPIYNGQIIATASGAPSVSAPIRVLVTYRSVRAGATGGRGVTVVAQTRPGFLTGPGRAERVQLLGVVRGRTVVLAVADAGQRQSFPREAHGINEVRFAVSLPVGTTALQVKVIGTPVNTGAVVAVAVPRAVGRAR